MTRKSNDGGKGRSTGRPGRGGPRSEGRAPRGEGGFKPRTGKGPGKGPAKGAAKGRSDGFKPRRASEGGEGRKEWFETRGENRGERFEKRGEGRPRRTDERGERRFTGEGRAFGPKKDFGKRPPRRDFGEGRETGDLKPWDQGDAPREKRREDGGGFRARREDTQRSGKFDRNDRDRAAPRDASKRASRPKKLFDPETPKPSKEQHERIAKVMARAGLCSRREAEEWIEAGRVSVNGEVLTSPARDVSDRDTILVDGKPLPTRERTRLFLYHKPRGLVTTAWDPEGRPTVFQNLPKGLPRVVTIGRLDINTEGLLLLTNDGGLARVISLPDTGWLRRYRVRAYGNITQPDLDALRDGIEIDGMRYGSIEAELQREQGDNVWLTIGLREGKNREVKRVLEHLGLQVNRLIRISFGPFQLGDLEEGAVEEVKTRILQEQLGPELAKEAQCDFDAPVFVYGEDDDFHPRKRDFPDEKRGARGDRFEKRARRNEEFEAEERPRPPRRSPLEIKTSVWRADDPDLSAERRRAPRRGADAKQDRLDTGAMAHKREGRVTSRKGKTALVERVVRGERPRRRDDEFEARPRRDRDDGERRERRAPSEGRSAKSFGDKGKSFSKGRDERSKAPRGERSERSERGGSSFSKGGEKSARRGAARAEPGGRGYSGKGAGGKNAGGKGAGGKSAGGGKRFGSKDAPRGGKPGGRSGGGKPGGRSGGAPRGRR
jgi:23S rRNA pseudouridine2605 synthase